MKTRTIYIAADGEEFDVEEECLEYERQCQARLDSVQFFDSNFKSVPPVLDKIESDAWYIRVLRAKDAENLFAQLPYEISFNEPDVDYSDGNVLRYDENTGLWINITTEYRKILGELNSIERAVNSL